MSKIKDLRKKAKLTQEEAAQYLKISRRTYQMYETNPMKVKERTYEYYCNQLENLTILDEEHGILEIDKIKNIVNSVLSNYDVNYCYLFGSYAKGKATPLSDVDLLIDSEITGLDYFGLIEELREKLHKKVDLLNLKQLNNNLDLIGDILKEGIKIYG